MRWAFPFIAAAITLAFGFAGAPGTSSHGLAAVHADVPVRLVALAPPTDRCDLPPGGGNSLDAMRQGAAAGRWDAAGLWTGLLIGAPDHPAVAAWRGLVNHTKQRDPQLASRTGCGPSRLAAR